jgi:hypothetical protein
MGFQARFISATNCIDPNSPANCVAAPAGQFLMAAGGTTAVVDTTAVSNNSEILITENTANGFSLGVTCNTTPGRTYAITGRVIGTNFTVTSSAAPATNPACLTYLIVNY